MLHICESSFNFNYLIKTIFFSRGFYLIRNTNCESFDKVETVAFCNLNLS